MTNLVDKQAKHLDYLTPPEILEPVRKYFGGLIPLDPATTNDNPTQASTFMTLADDGLSMPWNRPVFVNPPYGRELRKWCDKIYLVATNNATEILALLPVSRTEQQYMQDMMRRAINVCWIRKRVQFLRPDGTRAKSNPYASAIWGFNVKSRTEFANVFMNIGLTMSLT